MSLHPELIKHKKIMHDVFDKHDKSLEEFPLVHGRRSKMTTQQIMKQGICNMSPVDFKQELNLALKHFGKEKMLHLSQDRINRMIGGKKREIQDISRQNIWLSTEPNYSCDWAERSPEYITLALDYFKIPKEKIDKYLHERFGSCKVIELNETFPYELNINSMKRCIEPHQIKKVTECNKC